MMRLFVYEYTCAGAAGRGRLAEHLRTEGTAMLNAVLEDCRRLPGVETSTLWNEQLPANVCADAVHLLRAGNDEGPFRELASAADVTLVIAPESADILATRCEWLEAAGGRSLGSTVSAVRLTGDKLALAQHFHRLGVPSPECVIASTAAAVMEFPAVWKPRDGAGSTATFFCKNPSDCQAARQRAREEGWEGAAILQRFVPGRPVSVALLAGPAQTLPLVPAEQRLSADGRFHYLGGEIPVAEQFVDRAQGLALTAARTVPGLRGYVGVDLVLGAAEDGSQDWVIEINPRLTTSYVGLRRHTDANLMALLLDVVAGKPIVPPNWKSGSVVFEAAGEQHESCPKPGLMSHGMHARQPTGS
jgi:predicted ATP-grasp superfamily ATP-dependent carboligase